MSQIEPGDREEMLLQGILNGDTTTNIEPGSRKEMLLKAILENGGGGGLPVVTQQDDGKVLTVVKGQWMADSNAQLVDISYANLVALRDAGKLIPGQQYRIIDYETIIIGSYNLSALGAEGYIHYARSTENSWFNIIVTADDASHLNENARAARSDGVDYAPDAKPEAWELKYTIDNDPTKYAWADAQHGKGVIYFMRDEHNNSAGYDFKSIQFLRYALKLADATADYTPTDMANLVYDASTHPQRFGTPFDVFTALQTYADTGNYVTPFTRWYEGSEVAVYDFSVGYNILGTIQFPEVDDTYLSTFNADWYFTFDLDDGTEHTDISLGTNCYSNTISDCADAVAGMVGAVLQGLNGIVFESYYIEGVMEDYPLCYDNTFASRCLDMTFGHRCYCISCGANCLSNKIGNAVRRVTIGNGCAYNYISTGAEEIVMGNSCEDNIITHSRVSLGSDIENCIIQSHDTTVTRVKEITIPEVAGIHELTDYSGSVSTAVFITYTGYNASTAVTTTDGGATWA